MASVALRGAVKRFPNGVEALAGVDIEVADGELLVLVGPSGSGKTTALRAVAGLERLSAGSVLIGDDDVTAAHPGERDVAMVFQSYALYPNMTVARNIAFGLRARRVPRDEQRAKVLEIARALGIEDLLDRRPRMLSGGQRQRVAMGRAIVRDPRAFLMDEPLSNLDARLRVQMRGEIARIQRRLRTTTIYVTHDQVEAMTMGERVAVLDGGRVQQCDTPSRLYDAPANAFVARFMGTPPMNLLPARVGDGPGGPVVEVGGARLELPDAVAAARPGVAARAGGDLLVGFRPEATALAAPGSPGGIRGRVYLAEVLGSEVLAHVEVDGGDEPAAGGAPTDLVSEGVDAARVVCRLPRRSAVAAGDAVTVAVDTDELDFFDAETGTALARTGAERR